MREYRPSTQCSPLSKWETAEKTSHIQSYAFQDNQRGLCCVPFRSCFSLQDVAGCPVCSFAWLVRRSEGNEDMLEGVGPSEVPLPLITGVDELGVTTMLTKLREVLSEPISAASAVCFASWDASLLVVLLFSFLRRCARLAIYQKRGREDVVARMQPRKCSRKCVAQNCSVDGDPNCDSCDG